MFAVEKKLRSNIWKFYLIKFFYGVMFILPVLVVFWQNNGLSMTEIMLLQSVYSVLIVVLEVPSGYFADIFGRKLSILISVFCIFIGEFFYFIGHGFFLFLISEIVFAIGSSSLSGADSSFIYDTLEELGEEKKYKKIWGNLRFIFLISIALSSIIGGLIAKFGFPFGLFSSFDRLRFIVFISLPFLFISIIFPFLLYEGPHYKKTIEKGYLSDLFITLKKEVLGNKKLKWSMFMFMILGASLQFAFWFYQPYFKLIKLDVFFWGFVFAFFQIFSGLVGKYVHLLEKKIGLTKMIVLSAFLLIVSYFGMGFSFTLVGLVFIFFQQFVRGLNSVIISDYIHQNISSKYRATIQSIQSMGNKLLYSIFLPFFGYIFDIYSLKYALFAIGILVFVLLVPILIFLFVKKLFVFNK